MNKEKFQKMRNACLFCLLGILFFSLSANAQSYYRDWVPSRKNTNKDKIALIVANNYYENNGDLIKPIPTARKLKKVLERQGIDVLVGHDLNRRQFVNIVGDFGKKVPNYKAVMIFYMGHGFQINGKNYLIPVDANPENAEDVSVEAVSVDYIITKLNSADLYAAKPKIMVLDACRNNPWQKKFKSTHMGTILEGLTDLEAPINAEIFYTTQKNSKVADDNPYMEYFMNEVEKGGCIEVIVKKVSRRVRRNNPEQVPARYGLLEDDLCFGNYKPPPPPPIDIIPETPEGMVLVKGGSFMMGCLEGDTDCQSDEKPRHEVILSDFYMSKYEVTVSEFEAFINATAYKTDAEKSGGSYIWNGSEWTKKEGVTWRCDTKGNKRPRSEYNHPVIHVSWNDANAYARWKGARLPTEAEWEYAARSRGQNQKWAGTSSESSLDSYGNFCDKNCSESWKKENANDGYEGTAPVGSFASNDLGIYDMTGNVWEWCSDWYESDYYQKSPKSNPKNTNIKKYRSLRGGSWYNVPRLCRTSNRSSGIPTYTYYVAGFRLAQ